MPRSFLLLTVALSLAAARPRAQAPDIETPSLMTTPVMLQNGDQPIAQGTGFFYATTTAGGAIDTVFLVTNYHVVTGHEPGSAAHDGNVLTFVLHANRDDPTVIRNIRLPLFKTNGDPIWVSSHDTPDADVVLVPLPKASYEKTAQFVFSEQHTLANIRVRPTSPATLLGYPYGFYDQVNHLPVWKTGHIASEPNVDFQGKPVFLVDVSAFPGMSGSPVLAVANGLYENLAGQMVTGRVLKLLGIFSAMRVVRETKTDAYGFQADTTTETPLQLGYVWKASVIAEIANHYATSAGH